MLFFCVGCRKIGELESRLSEKEIQLSEKSAENVELESKGVLTRPPSMSSLMVVLVGWARGGVPSMVQYLK